MFQIKEKKNVNFFVKTWNNFVVVIITKLAIHSECCMRHLVGVLTKIYSDMMKTNELLIIFPPIFEDRLSEIKRSQLASQF